VSKVSKALLVWLVPSAGFFALYAFDLGPQVQKVAFVVLIPMCLAGGAWWSWQLWKERH
jgi:hypothetical protein